MADPASIFPAEVLPYGMTPAPRRRARVSAPIDLGEFDSAYEGFKVIIDLDLDMSVQDIIARMTDESISDHDRAQATRDFLERSLIAWNFTELGGGDDSEDAKLLPQPRAGGIALLKLSQLGSIAKAIAKAMAPSPN